DAAPSQNAFFALRTSVMTSPSAPNAFRTAVTTKNRAFFAPGTVSTVTRRDPDAFRTKPLRGGRRDLKTPDPDAVTFSVVALSVALPAAGPRRRRPPWIKASTRCARTWRVQDTRRAYRRRTQRY